jgi:serine phosphatase RsbU (regulator of sigma subunit)
VVESWDSYYSELSSMRQSIEQELRLARSIQPAFLPKEVPTLEGWQISPLYQPTREVGGDFYDFHPQSGGRLGLMPGMEYEEKEIVLDAGETALFYSDGLVEAHDPQGEMFGFPRLQELVAEHGEERSLGEFLIDELYTFVGEGWEQEDDTTLLALKRSASLS